MEKKETRYLPRLVEETIAESLLTKGCIVIEGAKWCGKSTTAERFAKTVIKLQDPAKFKQFHALADVGDKQKLFSGEKPIL
ncbi:MAG: AAA family ATPase, partial [Oscillospiraceae bacterium]|nr:AAA family ATPase [Oscillospiraceae bacterium]